MKIVLTHDADRIINQRENITIINSFHNQVTETIVTALKELGHEANMVETSLTFEKHIKEINPDLVFNTSIKRLYGSSLSFAPTILEKLNIPFTGPSAIACTNIFNKIKSNKILEGVGINAPHAIRIDNECVINVPISLKFPLFIKPLRGGCSSGITGMSIINSKDEYIQKTKSALEETKMPMIVEEFLPGREFTIGVLGNNELRVLPIMEFIFKEKEPQFRTFSKKMINYEFEKTICPAQINEYDKAAFGKLAISAFRALKCRDFARVDIRMDAYSTPKILEVNAIPNLEPETSSFAEMADQANITFNELIGEIIELALERKTEKAWKNY